MVTCCDTSFLFSLYGNDANSHHAVKWAAAFSDPITLSPYNAYELGNALRHSEFCKAIKPGEAALYWSQFEAAMRKSRLLRTPCNLADVLDEATRLSTTHTLLNGHRAFDILHVAAALVLRADAFLTFDVNQKKLARAEGLNSPLQA